jgi:AcrR family transcriptional regulator
MKRTPSRTQAAQPAANASSPSLRQRFRLLGRDAILDAASDLFLHEGYRATTMAAVADKAGVGVATVFRYFKTKEGILAALSRRDTSSIIERARAKVSPPPDDPVEAVRNVLFIVLDTHEMPSTKIRGQTRLWLLLPTGHPETDEVVTASDLELQELLLELLQHYRRAGRISKDLDLKDMTIAIFAVFYHHYLKIGVDRSVNIEQVRSELARRLPLLFQAWMVEAPIAPSSRGRSSTARSRGR